MTVNFESRHTHFELQFVTLPSLECLSKYSGDFSVLVRRNRPTVNVLPFFKKNCS